MRLSRSHPVLNHLPIRRGRFGLIAVSLAAAAVAWIAWPHAAALVSRLFRKPVDFSRDIRPIFNQNCTSCHGGVRQKNGVSFIFREEALGTGKSGHRTIVPGNPDASELIARVSSKDPDTRMPYHAPPLSPEQITLLRRWIKEGAKWTDHWAFVPPTQQSLPVVKRSAWVHQPLDRFILARLERESLQPSAEASKPELLRRVSLDLTGLPPTAEEEAAFMADASPNAYEKLVDRLLASTAYGERWASMWLDLARYADTLGYEADRRRPGVWPYRDWVIEAFNRNLPYDQFVTTQLAGDLLPHPTFEDRVATSFHRQTPNNQEGGTDDEEFRTIAVIDRVATTWSVLNGFTMNCVQCHSHPYDPIRHTDFYKSLAFFNTSKDADLDDDFPVLRVPKDKSRYAEASQIQEEISSRIHSQVDSDRELVAKSNWQPAPIQAAAANEVEVLEPKVADLQRDLSKLKAKKMPSKQKADETKDLLDALAVTQKRLAHAKALGHPARTFHIHDGEALADSTTPPESFYELTAATNVPGVSAIRVEVPPFDSEKARHTPENGFIVDEVRAWLVPADGRKEKIPIRYFIHDSEVNFEEPFLEAVDPKNLHPKKPVVEGFATHSKLFRTRWIVLVPAVPLHVPAKGRIQVDLKQTDSIDSKPALVQRVRLSVSGDSTWISLSQDASRAKNRARINDLEHTLAKIPTVELPIMLEEQPYEKRATLEFERGNFLTKVGPDLSPDVPAIFPKLPDGAPRNRLTLAKWFFTTGQPLTARVAVNRYWQELFGTGIVETLENFGSVGEPPSHPELLDWLALHFQNDLHWDMKALLREIVTSATYRQSAASTPTLTAKDPANRLLARGPQQRLTAEMVRDQALVASGLLNRTMGGPPVMPPQPAGVWKSVYNDDDWKDAKGPDRYRRAIYTFVKRTSGYPSFLTFDASDRDTSLPRRIPTNTPLQALVTLNDPVYQEAAESLAKRVMKESAAAAKAGASNQDLLDARLCYETRLVLSRDPKPQELAVLRSFFQKTLAMSDQPSSDGTKSMLLKVSLNKEKKGDSAKELDALTAVGSVLFNLDAALTR
jgi:Protein of unknown function (DUF1553)/Protein of unknown function (DUF1549)/Planctomycete cytochrome C